MIVMIAPAIYSILAKGHHEYLLKYTVSFVIPYYAARNRAVVHHVKAYHACSQVCWVWNSFIAYRDALIANKC